jgi:hypothetical protein
MKRETIMQMMYKAMLLSLIVCACFTLAQAQSGGSYQITQSVIPGGGGTSSNGSTTLTGTIGQGITGSSSGGSYTLDAGFVPVPTSTPLLSIGGRITFNGDNLASVTVSLSGTSAATTGTDASGFYTFPNLAAGSYTVTPSRANFSFTTITRSITLASANVMNADFTATSTASNPQPAGGSVIISEFRLSGASSDDEYIELYNNTSAPINLGGYHLDSLAGTSITIPVNTMIPARGHYLLAHATGYTLAASVAADQTYNFDLPTDSGLALFNSAGTIVDAVGFTSTQAPYEEGNSLSAVLGVAPYAYVRKLSTGLPQDTGNNAADFLLVSTDGNVTLAAAQLGAPGPENLSSPLGKSNAQLIPTYVSPMQCAGCEPNRVRDNRATAQGPNAAAGTLSIQRRFTNPSGSGITITRLRFRIVDITTLGSAGGGIGSGQADLRVLSSTGHVFNNSGVEVATVTGTTLETPPTQANGGGLNSTLTITLPAGGLTPGQSIDVQLLLGVNQAGNFRFFISQEALP